MPDTTADLDRLLDRETRIDLAARLDSALDQAHRAHDPALAAFLSLAAEIRQALLHPSLTPAERARIHARALALAEGRWTAGLRRTWPQLARPAVVGGAAAALVAVVGLAALREWRGQAAQPIFGAA